METLSQLTVYLHKQRLDINKINKAIEINCIFNNPSMQDMIDLFAIGCKLLDVPMEEAINNRKIMLPVMNWQYETMFISNLDRFAIGKTSPFFKMYVNKRILITEIQEMINETIKTNNVLPEHKEATIIFTDGSYKKDTEIETCIAVRAKEFVIGEYLPSETPQESTEMNEVPPNSPVTSEQVDESV